MVLDGEAIALTPDGRPRPFQETAVAGSAAAATSAALRAAAAAVTPFFFDLLHLDGADLLDAPGRERGARRWRRCVPEPLRVPRRWSTADAAEAAARSSPTRSPRGHEGVVVKSLDAPYEAGRRGAGWVKVKPRHTLDLVVLAAEWGHGRRTGWLSNLHLGARDPATAGS